MLRAWRGFDSFQGRGSLRGWLYKIATNTCLNALAGQSRRILPETEGLSNSQTLLGKPATEIPWLEPYPDAAMEAIADPEPGPETRYEMSEGVSLAFVAAIQYLPPRQRAVFYFAMCWVGQH
jgi:RNA polymerase sigma-70 factor (ECF subfamily)